MYNFYLDNTHLPVSLSLAVRVVTWVPLTAFSNTLAVYTRDENCGALSFTSITVIMTLAFDDKRGFVCSSSAIT